MTSKGSDQSGRMRRLVRAFAGRTYHIFYLVSKAEETGLAIALSGTPKASFVPSRPILT